MVFQSRSELKLHSLLEMFLKTPALEQMAGKREDPWVFQTVKAFLSGLRHQNTPSCTAGQESAGEWPGAAPGAAGAVGLGWLCA